MKSPISSSSGRRANQRSAIFRRDGYRCVYCGEVYRDRDLTVDHVQPRRKQGDHSPGNLVTACITCNVGKGGLPAWQFLRDRPLERENFLRYAIYTWPRLRRAIEEGRK
jgi:5-methylcytosine-specific restriction endonuclease McrA